MKKIDTFQAFARGAKSLVAILLVMLMAVGSLFAQTQTNYSHVFSAKTWSTVGTQELSSVNWTVAGTGNSGTYFGYDETRGQQFGSGSKPFQTLTITTDEIPGTISSITVNTSGASGNNASFKVKVGNTYFTYNDEDSISLTTTATSYTFTGSAEGEISLEWTQTTSKAIYWKSIEVVYTSSSTPAVTVAAPTFTPAAGNYTAAQSVTLATTTEGATIYYTIDGTEPTAESLIYQNPIEIAENTTIKAIAVLGENVSAVSTANYEINLPLTVANIAAFKALDLNTEATITGDVVVLGRYSKNLFVQDATGALLVYGNNIQNYEYEAGDVISGGINGKRTNYSGLVEMTNPGSNFAAGVAGNPIEPIVVTVAELIANYDTYESKLVTIENVILATDHTFGTSTSSNNYNKGVSVSQGEDVIEIFNQLATITNVSVEAGAKTVTGYWMRYINNNNVVKYEIAPRGAADIVDYVAPQPVVIEPTWVSCNQVDIFNTQVVGLVPTCETVGDSTVFHFAYTDAFNGYPTQNPNTSLGANANKVYVDIKVARPSDEITGIKYGDEILNFADIDGVQDFTLGAPYFADLTYVPVATVNGEVTEGNATDRNWTITYEWCTGNEVVAIQKLNILVDAAPVPEPVVIEPTWVSCDQVDIFNTQVVGLVPTCETVGDSTVFHFAYTDAFNGYPTQNPNTSLGANANKVYVDIKVARPSDEITGIKYGDEILNFADIDGVQDFTLGAPYFADLTYVPVATVNGEVTEGNATDRNWTITYEWCTGNEVVAIQKLNILVDAAPVPEPVVIEPTWVSCDQVDIFNTQVVGLVPTCETVGDSTVFHFAYTDAFNGYPTQNPNTSLGANANKVYVDIKVARPSDEITGIKYGDEILNFADIDGVQDFTLGAPYFADLTYVPVATVNGEVTEGNATDRNWTMTYEWCTGNEVVAIQKLNILVDAAPVQSIYDSIPELPYTYNFDEDGEDLFFMIENGENTNKWYNGKVEGFDNNKLYISSNKGVTNKYDVTKSSEVKAYREVKIPATGAVLSFDYRVNGETNRDYLKVDLNNTEIAKLSGDNKWNTFTYNIEPTMAGVVRVQFTWKNDNNGNGEQFPAAIDNISIVETPCVQPTALKVDTIIGTDVTVCWKAAAGQSAWTFEYKLKNHTEWYSMNVTDTFVTLPNLQGNSNYEMRVNANCGEYTSAWTKAEFSVNCQNEEVTVNAEDVVIGEETALTTNNYPFPGYYGWQYSAQLYDMEYSGPVHSIAFYLNAPSTGTDTSSMTVWVKAVDANYALAASNTFNTMLEGAQQIYSGKPDFSEAGWITFPVEDFTIAENQNLMVLVRGVGCTKSGGCGKAAKYTTAVDKVWWKNKDSNDPGQDVTGALLNNRANITINMDVTRTECKDVESCPAPENLTVSDITTNSAVLTWSAGAESQTSFIVEYMAEDAEDWTPVDVNDTTYTLEGLTQLTNYSVRVKANCGEYDLSEAVVLTNGFRTIGVCPKVSNLVVSNMSNTTTLTWEAGGSERNWKVQFKPASGSDDEWVTIDVEIVPMTTFGGLIGNTDYVVRVKALCDLSDEENQSEWAETTFTSGCAAIDELPYVQEFETSEKPACWESEGFAYSTNSKTARSESADAWLLSPAISIPAANTTYLAITSYVLSGEGAYTVLASYRSTREDQFEEIYQGTATTTSKQVITLPEIYSGKSVYFKIVAQRENEHFDAVEVSQCPFVPTTPVASNITGTTVDLAWEADEAVTNFQVKAGEQTWNVEDTNKVTIEDLDYGTSYSFQVRTNCGNGNYGEWSDAVSVTTKPACSEPTNLQAEALTYNSYYLTWNASAWTQGAGTQYVVGYKAAGETDYTETELIDTTFTTLGDLLPQTTYTLAVKAVCSEEYSSEWSNTITITTPCQPENLPFVEDFESTSFPPECWTSYYVSGPGSSNWNTNTTHHNGANGACIPDQRATTRHNLVTPKINVPAAGALLKFWVKRENDSYSSKEEEGIKVSYGVNENGSGATELIYIHRHITKEPVETAAGWYEYSAVIPQGQYYVIFQGINEWGGATYMDDISITEAPTCYVPSISVSGTTATITASTNGNEAQSYDLKIGENLAENVAGPTVDLSTLFTLESNTDYEVSVRANCGGEDNSEWSQPVSFRTPCLALALPYTEDFESYTIPSYYYYEGVMPDCWTDNWTAVAAYSSSHYEPKVTDNSSYNPGSSKYLFMHAGSSSSTNTSYQNPTIVILPAFNADLNAAMISFRARSYSASNGTLYLGYVNDENVFTELTSVTCATNNSAPLQTFMLDQYTIPAGAKLAFKAQNTASGAYATYMIGIDDIAVKLIPTCFEATIAVNGTNATITSSTNGDAAQSYNLKIGEDIVNVPSTPTTVDLSTLFMLEANTNYEVSVQAVCGEGNESEWSAAVPFKTPCAALSLPYTEGFEDYEGTTYNANGVVPNCWNSYSTGSVKPHVIVSGGSYAFIHTGTKALTFYGNGDCYATLPAFETPISSMFMSFWMRTENSSYGKLSLGYITAEDNNMNTFTQIGTAFSNTTSGAMVTPDLTQVPSNAYRLVFKWSYTSQWSCCIDDVNIEFIPTCATPSVEVSKGIATITPGSFGTTSSYTLQIGEETATVVAEAEGATTVNLPDSFTLVLGEEYDIQVITNCAEGTSEPALAHFKYEISYTIDEASSITTCGATLYDAGGADGQYGNSSDYTVTIYPESNNALIHLQGEYNTESNWDYIYVYDGVGTTGTQLAKVSGENTLDFTSSDATGALTVRFTSDNSGVRDGFAFNITCETIPTCFVPNNLKVAKDNVTDQSAVLTWAVNSSNPEAVNYVVEYKAADDEAWQTAATVSELTYTLEGLTASTNYMVRVKTDCGNQENPDESEYTEVVEFTTLCDHGYYSGNDVVCPDANDLAITSINSYAASCEVEGAVSIKVKNMGYKTVTSFKAYYQVNEEQPVEETVTVKMALLDDTTYTFTTAQPTFAAGENTLTAWVVLEGDTLNANDTITAAPVIVLEAATVPYLNFDAANSEVLGWNAVDANEDGITMKLNNNSINYTFNDEADADDWMMSPCIEMAAGKYTVTYDYKANSAMTESFEVYYGTGAKVESMTNAVATHTINNTTAETATTTIIVAEDGVYNFGFHATSGAGNMGFSINNFGVYPVINVLVESDTNGTVTPNGTIEVNYGKSLTLNLVPKPSYHVGGVEVDGVQVVPEDGTGANFMLYTLENITEPHTVSVNFKLEFKIHKEVVNYREDLYTENGGVFLTPNDTTIDPTPIVELMQADEHYHLNKLMLSLVAPGNDVDVTDKVVLVDTANRIYSYTTDTLSVANYYLTATFRRDTVAINYTVLTGKGYANDSELLTAGDEYTNWVDYAVYDDVTTLVTFEAAESYYIVDVMVNDSSKERINDYTFENVKEAQDVKIKFGYKVDALVSNYNTYEGIEGIMGTIEPKVQYIPEFDAMTVTGTVEENFHLYQLLVNGEDRISEVDFEEDPHNYSYTMNSVDTNYTIEAVVKVDTFAIVYIIEAGQGTVDGSDVLVAPDTFSTVLNYADNWLSEIVPDEGYSIGNVVLDGENLYTASNYQFNHIETGHEFVINFVQNVYTVNTNAYGYGEVSEGITFTFDPANPVNYPFHAEANEGYYIASVTINNTAVELTEGQNVYDTTINNVADNYEINVIFKMYTYTMSATAAEGGNITPDGDLVVNYGTDQTYEIVANEGWYIASVTVDGETSTYTQDSNKVSMAYTFEAVDADHSISATFSQFMYKVTANVAEDAQGNKHATINGVASIDTTVAYGSVYAVNFEAEANYEITDVVIDNESMGAISSYEFINITENHEVIVNTAAIMYTLTATTNLDACTITPADTTVQAGSNVTFTLTPAEGYDVLSVLVNGMLLPVNDNNTVVVEDIQSDCTIMANFAQHTVTVNVEEPENATITPGTQDYTYGATPSYMIIPEVGYVIDSVMVDGQAVAVSYNAAGIGSFTLDSVKANATVTASVSKKQFTIIVIAPEHGTISSDIPGDTITVEYGDNVTFTMTPANFYTIGDVLVDGSSRGQLNTYTFYNVTGNHTITAEFTAMSCDATVENMNVTDITLTSATLTWEDNAVNYDVRYRKAGEDDYVMIVRNDSATLSLTGLEYNTEYEWSVRAYCDTVGEGIVSDWTNRTFTTLDCNMPTNLTAVVDSINVTLTWEGTAQSYDVRYRKVGESEYNELSNVTETTVELTELEAGAQYEWGVKANCDEDITSEWAESTFTITVTGIASADLSSIKVYSYLNNVYIVNEKGISISNVDIYDIYGKQVYTGMVLSSPEVISLNVANGNYVVRLATENGMGVYKVAIVR